MVRREAINADRGLASVEVCENTLIRLKGRFNAVTANNDESAKFFYDESKASYEVARDRFKSLDSKAVTLSGIVMTALGAIALFGDPNRIPQHCFWFYSAVAGFVTSLGFALYSLAPRAIARPDFSPYIWPMTIADPNNLSRARIELARAWLRDTANLENANAEKGKRLRLGTLLFSAGLFGIVMNYLIAQPNKKPVSTIRVYVSSPEASFHEQTHTPARK